MLKKILLIITIFMMPIITNAQNIEELPPKVTILGIDEKEYDITKTITAKDVIVTVNKKNSKDSYSWTFNKNKIKDNLVLNFNIKYNSSKEKEIKNIVGDTKNNLYLEFSQQGVLPTTATIKMYVGNYYQDNEKLYLYYYNEDNDKVEFISKNLIVDKGYVTFTINHCSNYFLTTTIVNNAINNPKSINTIIMFLILVVISLVAVILFSNKK